MKADPPTRQSNKTFSGDEGCGFVGVMFLIVVMILLTIWAVAKVLVWLLE